jgi:chromosome segregation ATPase
MNCKQLEEEVHSLKCERAATTRQFALIKELNEEAQKAIIIERDKVRSTQEALEISNRTVQESIGTIAEQKNQVQALLSQKEEGLRHEGELSAKITELNTALAKEKTAFEDLSIALKAAEESRTALHLQLEQERRSAQEAAQQAAMAMREKEAAEHRVKEVEELLIAKVQTMSDLEEQLGEAITDGEAFESRALCAEENVKGLTADLQKMTEGRDELHQRGLALEQQLAKASTENAELKKRSESFERLKKSVLEASSHAHAILKTFGSSPKSRPIAEDFAEEQERPLFEEHFEQHELF